MKLVSRRPEEGKKQAAERESEKLLSGKKENGSHGVNFIACAREANFRAGNESHPLPRARRWSVVPAMFFLQLVKRAAFPALLVSKQPTERFSKRKNQHGQLISFRFMRINVRASII